MRTFILVLLVGLVGCASQPQTSSDSAAKAPSPSQSPSAASPAPVAAPAAVVADSDETKFKVPSGYSQKTRDDETVYCRKYVPLGTRFPKEECFTVAELRDLEIRNQAMRDRMSETSRICSGGSACAHN